MGIALLFQTIYFLIFKNFFIKLHLSGTLWIKIPMCRLKYYSIDFCVRVAAVDQYENPDSWVLFQKSLCELMCVSKISSFHLDKKCAAIYYLLRWPLPPNDPKCVTQYFETLIRIGPGSWRWLIYGALSKKCPYNSCWLLIQIVKLRPFDHWIILKCFCDHLQCLFPYQT